MSKIARFRRKTNGFAKGNHFCLGIFDFKGAMDSDSATPIPMLSSMVNTGRGMTMTQVMSTFCSSMTLPATQTPAEMINIQEGLPKIQIAGTKVYSPWTVEFQGDNAMLIRSMLLKWHQFVVNDTNHSYGLSSAYKSQTAFACLLSPTDIPIHCYSFKGLWPSEIGGFSVDQSSSEILKFSVTFSYDYFKMNDVEGFGLAMAQEINEAFQTGGGLFGGGLRSAGSAFREKVINAPLSTDISVPF